MTKNHILLFWLLIGLSSAAPISFASAEAPDEAVVVSSVVL